MIAAVQQLQAGRAWLWSLLADVADTAPESSSDTGAIVVLPDDLLAEMRAALAACR